MKGGGGRGVWAYRVQQPNVSETMRFSVTEDFIAAVQELAVPQRQGRMYPGRPQLSDLTKAGDSRVVGIPDTMFEWLLDSMIPGSAVVWTP